MAPEFTYAVLENRWWLLYKNEREMKAMKTDEKQRQADYLLLYSIVGRYLEKCIANVSLAPRYLMLENINDIVEPFHQIKPLIQRVEWLQDEEYITELIEFLVINRMSIEELRWAIDMFAIEKQDVFDRIEKRIQIDE